MKLKHYATLLISSLVLSLPLCGSDMGVGIVNFKQCIEESQVGKSEKEAFESIKTQMTEVLEAKDQELTELSQKFSDADYLDSLTPEAEEELKEEFRKLNQELAQYQNQYYQVLNAANAQLIDTISDMINKASKELAKEKNLQLVLNEYTASYFDPDLDISNEIITKMDDIYKIQQGENEEASEE